MTEEFLHFIWQYKLYDAQLQLIDGEQLTILHPGIRNFDSGPDFFNARIRIGDTEWAGNVEIHMLSSDWNKHRHSLDHNYSNIILHVVWRNDTSIIRSDGSFIPTLELDGRYNATVWHQYVRFMESGLWIPCGKMSASVEPMVRNAWLDRLLIERLERKSGEINRLLDATQNDWSQVFYYMLATKMGFNVNNHAFEQLARSLPLGLMAKHADDLFQLEALIFGQAGLLINELTEEYPVALRKEYGYLRKKYNINPIEKHLWKFMRLHPGNFPTIRLAQFAAIIYGAQAGFDTLLDAGSVDDYRKLFAKQASAYWDTHYSFGKLSAHKPKILGKTSADLLIINLVAPLLLAYGQGRSDNAIVEKAVNLLSAVPPENNKITRQWVETGFEIQNAAISQALIQLKTAYCSPKKCLQCAIGNSLLRQTS